MCLYIGIHTYMYCFTICSRSGFPYYWKRVGQLLDYVVADVSACDFPNCILLVISAQVLIPLIWRFHYCAVY